MVFIVCTPKIYGTDHKVVAFLRRTTVEALPGLDPDTHIHTHQDWVERVGSERCRSEKKHVHSRRGT